MSKTMKLMEAVKTNLKEGVEVSEKVYVQLVQFLKKACNANDGSVKLQYDECGVS